MSPEDNQLPWKRLDINDFKDLKNKKPRNNHEKSGTVTYIQKKPYSIKSKAIFYLI